MKNINSFVKYLIILLLSTTIINCNSNNANTNTTVNKISSEQLNIERSKNEVLKSENSNIIIDYVDSIINVNKNNPINIFPFYENGDEIYKFNYEIPDSLFNDKSFYSKRVSNSFFNYVKKHYPIYLLRKNWNQKYGGGNRFANGGLSRSQVGSTYDLGNYAESEQVTYGIYFVYLDIISEDFPLACLNNNSKYFSMIEIGRSTDPNLQSIDYFDTEIQLHKTLPPQFAYDKDFSRNNNIFSYIFENNRKKNKFYDLYKNQSKYSFVENKITINNEINIHDDKYVKELGGIVIREPENKIKGLIFYEIDKTLTFKETNKACDSLINGFSDWRLPTSTELYYIETNSKTIKRQEYWSSETFEDPKCPPNYCLYAIVTHPDRSREYKDIDKYKTGAIIVRNFDSETNKELDSLDSHNKVLKQKIIELNEKIKLNPKNADFLYSRAISKYLLEDDEGAIIDFNKVIEIEPTIGGVYYQRARAKNSLNDYKGVIQDINYFFKYSSEDTDKDKIGISYSIRGKAYYMINDKINACLNFGKGDKLGNADASANFKNFCK